MSPVHIYMYMTELFLMMLTISTFSIVPFSSSILLCGMMWRINGKLEIIYKRITLIICSASSLLVCLVMAIAAAVQSGENIRYVNGLGLMSCDT